MAQLWARMRAASIALTDLPTAVRQPMGARLWLQHLRAEAAILRQLSNVVVSAARALPFKLRAAAGAGALDPGVDALEVEDSPTFRARPDRRIAGDFA